MFSHDAEVGVKCNIESRTLGQPVRLYRLTTFGWGLIRQLLALVEWGAENFEKIVAACAAFASRQQRNSRSHRPWPDATTLAEVQASGSRRDVDMFFRRVALTACQEQ